MTTPSFTPAVRLSLRWAALLTLLAAPSLAQSLSPSRASLDRQNRQARQHDYTYLRTANDVQRFVQRGWLVPMRASRDVVLSNVSFPYTRPAVRQFIRNLASEYRAACGYPLVVTSLTRPKSHQPRNASPRSVHPTGMALDLRRGQTRACRSFLDAALLDLESQRLIEATWERSPPHYHVAVFPRPYERYLASGPTTGTVRTHRVRRGDSLWKIARHYRTNVYRIQRANRLRGNVIRPGQVLKIPTD